MIYGFVLKRYSKLNGFAWLKHEIRWNLSISTGCRLEVRRVLESKISAKLLNCEAYTCMWAWQKKISLMFFCKCYKLSNIKILRLIPLLFNWPFEKESKRVKGILSHRFLNGSFCLFLLQMSFLSERIEIKCLFPFQSDQNSS